MSVDISTRREKVGFLIQPRKTGIVGSGPIGDSATANHWTNASSSGADFYSLHCIPGTPTPNEKLNINDTVMTSDATIYKRNDRTVIDSTGVLPSITMEMYASPTSMVAALIASYQQVVQTAVTFQKTVEPADELLDYPNNEGHLFTVAGADVSGTTLDGYRLDNALANSWTWSVSNNAQGEQRIARQSIEWIGRELAVEQTMSGAFTTLTDDLIHSGASADEVFTLDITTDNETVSDVCWRNFSVTVTNNIISDCFTEGGKANNFKRQAPTIHYTIDLVYNGSLTGFWSDYKEGSNVDFLFQNAHAATAAGHVSFDNNHGFLTADPRVVQGDEWAFRLEIEAVTTSAQAWGGIVVNDGVDWSDGLDTT